MATKKPYIAVHMTTEQMDAVDTLRNTPPYIGMSRAEIMRRGLELLLFESNIPIPQRLPRRGTYNRD